MVKEEKISYGAIIIAIVGAITTSVQYFKTVEETKQAEISRRSTNDVIIEVFSKEIERVQKECASKPKLRANVSWKDFAASADKKQPEEIKYTYEEEPKKEIRTAEDIRSDIYGMIND